MSIFAIDLRLGASSSDTISPERRHFHLWIAETVTGTKQKLIEGVPGTTYFLTPSDVQNNAGRAYTLILESLPAAADLPDCVLIDISSNAYASLRDTVLFHIANALRAIALLPGSRQLVVLFPQQPSGESLFWRSIGGTPTTNTIYVLGVEGTWAGIGESPRPCPDHFGSECRREYAAVIGDMLALLKLKLVRRFGHFHWINGDVESCSHSVYDATIALHELKSLLMQVIVDAEQNGSIRRPDYILTFAPPSPWLHQAGLAIATQLDIPCADLAVALSEGAGAGAPLLLTDLVATGATLTRVITEGAARRLHFQAHVFSAFGRAHERTLSVAGRSYVVHSLALVSPDTTKSEDCPQCALGLPFASSGDEEPLQLRTYDLWHMFDQVPWNAEHPVPPGKKSLGVVPDLKALFEQFGDWLAFKIEQRLRAEGLGDDLVVVVPDEPVPDTVLLRLRIRYEQRLVPIRVPRSIITTCAAPEFTCADLEPLLSQQRGEVWADQLRTLDGMETGVVILDEFNASWGTWRGLSRILGCLGVPVLAYFPILNRSPLNAPTVGYPILSLYDFDAPRAGV